MGKRRRKLVLSVEMALGISRAVIDILCIFFFFFFVTANNIPTDVQKSHTMQYSKYFGDLPSFSTHNKALGKDV